MAPSAITEYPDTNTIYDHKVNFIDIHHGDDETNAAGLASRALVQKVLKEQVARINTDTCEPGEEDAFYTLLPLHFLFLLYVSLVRRTLACLGKKFSYPNIKLYAICIS